MSCPHIPEMSYREFGERLNSLTADKRLPLVASFDLTERCNLNCVHCYINQSAGDREIRARELDGRQWARILAEAATEGCLFLLLTGGEPLLRPDFQEIYTYAKKLGMLITLFTNGTLITPALADFLRDYPPLQVEITVYGRTLSTYEAVTRTTGAFEKCMRGIELLLARQIPLKLKTMVMTLNAHELWDLKAWAEGLGVQFYYDPVLNPRLDGGKEPLALRLSPEEVVEFDLRDETRLQSWQEFVAKFGKAPESEYLYQCGAGVESAHVDAFGKMHICTMSRSAGFDLTRKPLKAGWDDFLPRLRNQKPRGDYPCGQCALISLCGQCPAWAVMENGDPERAVSYLCRIGHLRAETLNFKPDQIGGIPYES